jgi:hypothetical protein
MGAQPTGRRCVGLDVHREFAQVAVRQAGVVRQEGPIATTAEELRAFAETLDSVDEVALGATGLITLRDVTYSDHRLTIASPRTAETFPIGAGTSHWSEPPSRTAIAVAHRYSRSDSLRSVTTNRG